jgi:DNA-binding NarL/FixJ family response regulator
MADRIRIMLVEDHQVVRQGLVALLSSMDDLEVVGSVGDGSEAIEMFHTLQPDVTLMDLQMPKEWRQFAGYAGSFRRRGLSC